MSHLHFNWYPGVNFTNMFMRSFYVRRSKKRKKDSQLKQLFALLGSVCLKDARKHVGEIDPRQQVTVVLFLVQVSIFWPSRVFKSLLVTLQILPHVIPIGF